MPQHLYLVRHGHAQGSPRSLTHTGQEQVVKTADWLTKHLKTPCKILSSPSQRTLQTANLISHALSTSFQEDPTLKIDADPTIAATFLESEPCVNLIAVSHQPLLWKLVSILSNQHYVFPEASVCALSRTVENNTTWQLYQTFDPTT